MKFIRKLLGYKEPAPPAPPPRVIPKATLAERLREQDEARAWRRRMYAEIRDRPPNPNATPEEKARDALIVMFEEDSWPQPCIPTMPPAEYQELQRKTYGGRDMDSTMAAPRAWRYYIQQ
jgi:hypothetical protein